MDVLFTMLSMLGIETAHEPVMTDDKLSEQATQQNQSLKTSDTLDDELTIHITYKQQPTCHIHPGRRVIYRNLTQPYSKQTVYLTEQCQNYPF